MSIGLQYGVPLETYVSKFTNLRFERAGLTDDPDVRMAESNMDYIFRRLALDYLPFESRSALGIYSAEERQRQLLTEAPVEGEEEYISESESLKFEPVVEAAEVEAPKAKAAPEGAHTSAELLEAITGTAVDSRSVSPAARRCARPAAASSAKVAGAPAACWRRSAGGRGTRVRA